VDRLHLSRRAHRSRAQNAYPRRVCESGALNRARSGSSGTNVKAGMRVWGRGAHTTRRRLLSADRRKKTPRAQRVCQQARVRETTRLGSRRSGRGSMTERGAACAGELHLRRSAGAQTARTNAGQDALERDSSRLAVAGPAARLSESALASVLLRSRAALTSGGCCSNSAAHRVTAGHLHARRAPAAALRSRARCSSASAQTPANRAALLRVPVLRSRCACAGSCPLPSTRTVKRKNWRSRSGVAPREGRRLFTDESRPRKGTSAGP
jgi:hypothetical protein